MKATDGQVVGTKEGNLITIYIDGVQLFHGLSPASAGILLDTILTFVAGAASYLFTYKGDVVHSSNVAPLGRVLSVLLSR